jgi:hypothetical protein
MEIWYRDGHLNGAADGLSRLVDPDNFEQNDNHEKQHVICIIQMNANGYNLAVHQDTDSVLRWLREVILDRRDEITAADEATEEKLHYWRIRRHIVLVDNVLFRDLNGRRLLLIGQNGIGQVIGIIHNDGHLGVNKTEIKIRSRFYWFKMTESISEFIRVCNICQIYKSTRLPVAPLTPIQTRYPFELITADSTGPLPPTANRNRYILVVVDHFTKFVQAYALRDQTAPTFAECLVNYFFTFGLPTSILTDQGPSFQSNLLREIYIQLDINQLRTTPYHPETDGQTERMNQTIKQMIRTTVEDHQEDWDLHLNRLVFVINSSVNRATKHTPFELLFGRPPRIPIDLLSPSTLDFEFDTESYAVYLKNKLLSLFQAVKEHHDSYVDRMRIQYNRKTHGALFDVGTYVLVKDERPRPHTAKKLNPRFRGPFVVQKIIPPVNLEVKCTRTNRTEVVLLNKVRKYCTLVDLPVIPDDEILKEPLANQ